MQIGPSRWEHNQRIGDNPSAWITFRVADDPESRLRCAIYQVE
jgi:hypothetical protein